MSDPKRPTDKAKESLERGLSEVLRAARSAGQGIKKEIDKGGIAKTLEDSSRELLRAATNVATYVGGELQTWGQKAQETLDPQHRGSPATPEPPEPDAATRARPWPTTRDEFEARFGKVAGDWPRSAEEFERRFGYAPRDKPVGPTPHDPGFRIATGGDDER